MIKKTTLDMIDKLTDDELEYSRVQHCERFASLHEAESVIREELEELEEAVDLCRKEFDVLHDFVRSESSYGLKNVAGSIIMHAKSAAAEALQLGAMCKKLDEFEDSKPMCAHWDDIDGKTWCSRCGASNKAYKSPYCPHCGAKMEGAEKNENGN